MKKKESEDIDNLLDKFHSEDTLYNKDKYIKTRKDILSKIEQQLIDACKEQRENCMREYQKIYQEGYTKISIAIDKAPEPDRIKELRDE